ncbi:MAG: S8 family serine peptidase, partial [Halobacteriovoraceae bacterium]|nr:S8 family serine peptidase [Halobacteriovoraceae bacterium]
MGNTKLRLQLILVIFLALLQSCESPKSGADNTPVAEIETPTNPTDPDDTPIKTPEQIAAIELRNSSPFILNKVQVGNSDDITSDQELIVIVDDRCRLEQIANDGLTPIDYFTLPVPNENAMDLLIPVQAYSIQLNSDVRIENLSDNISNNPCIVGISHESYLETTAFDDTIFSKQDYLKQINFAKNIDFFQKNTTEKIVKIAILDTGIDLEHEEFSPKSFSTQLVGTNFIDPNSPDFPEEGASYHGTSLTGMLVADSNNMQGIASMNPGNFLILPIKVANDQAITLCSSLINGVFRAVNAGADIINISLGKKFSEDVFHCGSALADATNRAIRRGVFVTIAAGNAEYNEFGEMIPPVKIESPLELKIGSKCLYFPSCLARKFRGMVTVASLDETYKDLADFSNYGDVEIAAPGVGMTTLKKANAYGTVAGTSYSAALVTGAAAYIIGFAKQNGYTYSPWLVEDILLNSAAKADSLTDKVIAGRYLDLSSLKKYLL